MMSSFLMRIARKILGKYYDYNLYLLRREIVGSYQSLLDLGCGNSSRIVNFAREIPYKVGVDISSKAVANSRKLRIHDKYYQMHVLEAAKTFGKKSFDCVIALDLIEHLTKEDGSKLLKTMEEVARKKIIILTPNGYLPQGSLDGNEHQAHQSGWSLKEMRDYGYRVTGIGGFKFLRRSFGEVKWRPRIFWQGISVLTQFVTLKYPRLAFWIFCVKEVAVPDLLLGDYKQVNPPVFQRRQS